MENAYHCFSDDFYFFNILCGLFPLKEEKYGVCIAVRIRLLKQKGELVLMEQFQHYCLVNISFKLTYFRNKSLKCLM